MSAAPEEGTSPFAEHAQAFRQHCEEFCASLDAGRGRSADLERLTRAGHEALAAVGRAAMREFRAQRAAMGPPPPPMPREPLPEDRVRLSEAYRAIEGFIGIGEWRTAEFFAKIPATLRAALLIGEAPSDEEAGAMALRRIGVLFRHRPGLDRDMVGRAQCVGIEPVAVMIEPPAHAPLPVPDDEQARRLHEIGLEARTQYLREVGDPAFPTVSEEFHSRLVGWNAIRREARQVLGGPKTDQFLIDLGLSAWSGAA